MPTQTSKSSGQSKSKQSLEEISSKQILDTLRAWQNESETVDPKALLKALRAFRKGGFTIRLPDALLLARLPGYLTNHSISRLTGRLCLSVSLACRDFTRKG